MIANIRVWAEEEYQLQGVVILVRNHPGLNQKQLATESQIPEKKLRILLNQAVGKNVLRQERGSRKELLYYPAEEK